MLKYVVIVLVSIAINAYASSPCCETKERSTSFLDIAVDLISKAKLIIPECEEIAEVKEEEVKEKVKEVKNCTEERAMDCADWYKRGHNKSGVFTIWPINRLQNKPVDVYCDMETDGGGWTVIQRRGQYGNPSDYFYKDWASYKTGFGDIQKEFWLGNDNIFAMTNQKSYSIRFDLQDKSFEKAHANYSKFWIDDEHHKYNLHISGYSGNASDGMTYHNNQNFTTKDQKNNIWQSRDCVKEYSGAWWYKRCYEVCLNGLNKSTYGIIWNPWRGTQSLILTEMKIRPEIFVMKDSAEISKLRNII